MNTCYHAVILDTNNVLDTYYLLTFCYRNVFISDDSIYRNFDNIEFDIDISNRIVKKYRIFRYIALFKKISQYF